MINEEILTILGRIDADLALVRQYISGNETEDVKTGAIPGLRSQYTRQQAIVARRNIDAAFQRGEITYDKRRGMKMVVTKSTIGWSPVKVA